MGVSEAVGVSSCCTFDVVDNLFVVVCVCGPHDNLSHKLSYLLHVLCAGGGDWMRLWA